MKPAPPQIMFVENPPRRRVSIRAIVSGLLAACAGAAIVEAAPVGDTVVIHEIFADPGDGERDAEFVEVYNRSRDRVDLSGWQIAGGVQYVFPRGAAIAPGGYAVVALSPETLKAAFGVDGFGPWNGRLSADGEKLRLLDADAVEIDEVEYGCGYPWPVAGKRDRNLDSLFPGEEDSNDGRASIELVNVDADNRYGGAWRESDPYIGPTPGAKNGTATTRPPAVIDTVEHQPRAPRSNEGARITAIVESGDSAVESVVLRYQVVLAGDFVPAWTAQEIDRQVYDVDHRPYDGPLNPRRNPAFESAAAWRQVAMKKTGANRHEASIPGQPNRTLVRYRIFVDEGAGAEGSARAPQAGDPSLNFAFYVSDGVPDYEAALSRDGGARIHPPDVLSKLPVYALVSRAEDVEACVGHSRVQRLDKGSDASKVYNWEGALVYDGIVYDHIRYRLRGGNGRYLGNGKRSMKFRFNRGHYFAARDQRGRKYAARWRVLECSKMFSNRMVGNFGLVDSVNGKLWRMMGVPTPRTHWFHFRVVDAAAEAEDQWSGDFWGLMLAQEHYDKRFLKEHGLAKGNLYKLSDGVWGGESQARFLAPDAVDDYSDYDAIEYDLSDWQSPEWIRERVDIDHWARFSAVKEAVRHYDFWPGANKNMVYYFAPVVGSPQSKLRLLPYDHDDTWGPCWNYGLDCVTRAVEGDKAINTAAKNVLREFRDLVWQSDQLNPMLDDLARTIEGFVEADHDRWWHAPRSQGRENYGTLEEKLEDMKRFAWYGGNWPGGDVGHGGRARFLDRQAADGVIPATPIARFSGGSGFPADALRFVSSGYDSPSPFAAMEWRLAVITSPADLINPFKEARKFEWEAAWESGELPVFAPSMQVPFHVVKPGDLCRVRVRHRDDEGRWSHWSMPSEFICSAPTSPPATPLSIVISEMSYHPRAATADEVNAGFSTKDFEWIEILNLSEQAANLGGAKFTKGIDYTFADGVELGPGKRLVLTKNARAFALRYGSQIPVHGEWDADDALSDGGERVRMKAVNGDILFDLHYDDQPPWPVAADGAGNSLELTVEDARGERDLSKPRHWRASPRRDGTPGF